MGLQKYHAHNGGAPEVGPNGAEAHYGRTMFGRHLAFVRKCPVANVANIPPRTAYVTGEADTYFSIPAAVSYRGCTIRGYLTCEDGAWAFNANKWNPAKG